MASPRTIRIATRASRLALWQTETVKARLEAQGLHCEIVTVESTGDIQLTKPIYELGISGVFTKQLDIALLDGLADLAVHSLKDVPTTLAENLVLAAVLERGPHEDVVLVKSPDILQNKESVATIASSSLRRRAQWLSRFSNHNIVPIRGNVQTRLDKYHVDKSMDGVIFAKAGLERLGLLPDDAVTPDWMLPAPAQGIIGIVCRADDNVMLECCSKINHEDTFAAGTIERQFLKTLMGGCSVPISALAQVRDKEIEFTGAMHSYDGKRVFAVKKTVAKTEWKSIGKTSADELLLQTGALDLLNEIRNRKFDDKGTLDQNA